jgi:hypothetical protein
MKKQYTVTASLPGCMPDNSSRYGTKAAAVWGMTYELENWAEAWKYQYDPEKKEEVKNPYWRVLGSAQSGFYQVQLGKFHFINICMHVDVVYAEDEED